MTKINNMLIMTNTINVSTFSIDKIIRHYYVFVSCRHVFIIRFMSNGIDYAPLCMEVGICLILIRIAIVLAAK